MIKPINISTEDKSVWTSAEHQAWQVPRRMPAAAWADDNIILLPKTSAEPGPYRSSRTPYIVEPLNCLSDDETESITAMFSTQTGKTQGLTLNGAAYIADQDPGPAIIVCAREEDAQDISESRLMPMFRESPALRRHITDRKYDFKRGKYNLDQMIMYFAWAGSPSALASKPVRYIFFEELDKYPSRAGEEADPSELAIERTRTYWNRKIIKSSTPTTKHGAIYREYQQSDKRQYYVPCPHCGEYQTLIFGDGGEAGGGVNWPKDIRLRDIKAKRAAWYQCAHCKGKITDIHKPEMLRRGVWCPEGGVVSKDGTVSGVDMHAAHKGYWLNCLYSPWLTFSEIAHKFLKSKDDIEKFQNFVNSWLAEVWDNKIDGATESGLRRRIGSYPKNEVPPGVKVLTAAVDVHKYYYNITVRGWGMGEESWLIRADRIEGLVNAENDWDIIYQELSRTYKRQNSGDEMDVRLAGVDSGYRTEEVYDFCNRFRDWIKPLKGSTALQGRLYRASPVEHNPRTGKRYRGLILYLVAVDVFKDKLARLIDTQPGDPAEWHLYDCPSPDYFKHLAAEEKVLETDKRGRRKEVWQLVSKGRANHFLDGEVYNTALATILGVPQLLKRDPVDRDGRNARPAPPPRPAPPRPKDGRGKWNNRGKNWRR